MKGKEAYAAGLWWRDEDGSDDEQIVFKAVWVFAGCEDGERCCAVCPHERLLIH